eukprot:375384-Amphidinium_carterae.1
MQVDAPRKGSYAFLNFNRHAGGCQTVHSVVAPNHANTAQGGGTRCRRHAPPLSVSLSHPGSQANHRIRQPHTGQHPTCH